MAFTAPKKKLLKKSRLYVILDRYSCRHTDCLRIFKIIKDKGVDVFQLRDKISPKVKILRQALRLKQLLNKNKNKNSPLFIVNDFADIAKIADADGLHIGRGDLSIRQARNLLGKDKIIGVTCRNLKQLSSAKRNGADYVAIGPVFNTSIKPKLTPLGLDRLKRINEKKLSIPLFAIGGINEANLDKVMATGISRVAVCSAVCQAARPSVVVKKLNSHLSKC